MISAHGGERTCQCSWISLLLHTSGFTLYTPDMWFLLWVVQPVLLNTLLQLHTHMHDLTRKWFYWQGKDGTDWSRNVLTIFLPLTSFIICVCRVVYLRCVHCCGFKVNGNVRWPFIISNSLHLYILKIYIFKAKIMFLTFANQWLADYDPT